MAKKRWFRWWLVPIALLAGGIGTAMYYSDQAERRFQSELALCRAAGMALTAEDLRKDTPPGDQNAAGHYQQAIALKKGVSADSKEFMSAYDPTKSEEELKKILGYRYKGPYTNERRAALLAEWKPAFDAAALGATRPRLDFNRPWEKGHAILLPEFGELKSIATALTQDAALKVEQGNLKGAMASLELARQIGVHTFEEATIIAQLVGTSIISIANRNVLRLALSRPKDLALTKAARAYFDRELVLPDLRRGLMGETYLVVATADQLAADPRGFFGVNEDSNEPMDVKLIRIKAVRRTAQASLMKAYREAWVALPKDRKEWEIGEERLAEIDRAVQSDQSYAGKVASLMAAAYTPFGQVPRRSVQSYRLARVSLALLAEKQRTGRFPPTLADMGEDTIDLYSDQNLRYIPGADGFKVYSVGQDRKDNGGGNYDSVVSIEKGVIEIR